MQERRYAKELGRQIKSHAPDVVLSVPSSLDAQAAALRASREIDAAFVFWLQDLYSLAIERLLGRRSRLAGRAMAARFIRLERRLLQRSDAVVAISEDFVPTLTRWQVDPGRVTGASRIGRRWTK